MEQGKDKLAVGKAENIHNMAKRRWAAPQLTKLDMTATASGPGIPTGFEETDSVVS